MSLGMIVNEVLLLTKTILKNFVQLLKLQRPAHDIRTKIYIKATY